MRSFMLAILVALAPAALAGCATSATVQAEGVEAGTPQVFPSSYDVVKAAALESVERMNVNVQGTDETPERFQIRFTKSISAFSWG
jgi:hypothetical protein